MHRLLRNGRRLYLVMRTCAVITVGTLLSLVAGCGPDFAPASTLRSVRILATVADQPYAAPDAAVTLTTLAGDFSTTTGGGVPLSYFPAPCVNPKNDDAANCYPTLVSGYPAGVDVTPTLAAGDTFTFAVPGDAIATHAPSKGGPPYGVVFVFMAACAGHIELVGIDGTYPSAPPFACFDDQHTRLDSHAFVFGYARIYVFEELRNTNPVLLNVTLDGAPLDETAGATLPRCTQSNQDDCPAHAVDTAVDAAEPDVAASVPGYSASEQVWVSYFVTGAAMRDDISILSDARTGMLAKTGNELRAPSIAGDYGLWAVVRDSRGGVAWKHYPIHVN